MKMTDYISESVVFPCQCVERIFTVKT